MKKTLMKKEKNLKIGEKLKKMVKMVKKKAKKRKKK